MCIQHCPKGYRTSTRGAAGGAKPDSVIMKEAANAERSPPSTGFLSLNQN